MTKPKLKPIALDTLEVFTPAEAAEFLRLKVDTLRIWRRDRRGPKHTKVGGRVRYRREDLEKYLKARSS